MLTNNPTHSLPKLPPTGSHLVPDYYNHTLPIRVFIQNSLILCFDE